VNSFVDKQRKNNRQAKLPKSAAVKRRFPGTAVVFLAVAIVVAGVWWWKSKSADVPPGATPNAEANAANSTAAGSNVEFQKLKGRWQRPDGGYIMEIKSVASDGAMDAAYFNPKSIHVAKAEASREGGATKHRSARRELSGFDLHADV